MSLVAAGFSVCCYFSGLGIDCDARLVRYCVRLDCLSRVSNVLGFGGLATLFEFRGELFVVWWWLCSGVRLVGACGGGCFLGGSVCAYWVLGSGVLRFRWVGVI